MVIRLYPVVSCPPAAIEASQDFYRSLLDLDVVFEAGWYTILRCPAAPAFELALVAAGHPTMPPEAGTQPCGVLASFVVPDVDRVHQRAVELGAPIVLPLQDEAFGQRHFMVRDPAGLVVDVITEIPPSRAFLKEVATWRRTKRQTGVD